MRTYLFIASFDANISWQMFYKIGILKNFAKCTGKQTSMPVSLFTAFKAAVLSQKDADTAALL